MRTKRRDMGDERLDRGSRAIPQKKQKKKQNC